MEPDKNTDRETQLVLYGLLGLAAIVGLILGYIAIFHNVVPN